MHVGSVSSGKDSQATMLLMLDRIPRESCRFVIADTGNEDPAVWEHLDYLRDALDIQIDVVRADFSDQIAAKRLFIARDLRAGRVYRTVDIELKDGTKVKRKVGSGRRLRWTNKAKRRALQILHPTGNPYLDLCLWKGRFPARKAQFCTQELKTIPLVEYQIALMDQGYGVVSWQGVRRDESANRRDAKMMQRIGPRLWAFRPIIHWTAQQVVDFSLSRGLRLNRLYAEGFDRVGCMPCINCGKKEISNIALRKPAELVRLAEWERLVGLAAKRGESSFFPSPNRSAHLDQRGIEKIVEWAHTTRGGKQYNLLVESDVGCSSSYGLCEQPANFVDPNAGGSPAQ